MTKTDALATERKQRGFRNSRFFKALKHNPFGALGLAIVIAFFVLAAFPQAFTSHDPVKLSLRTRIARALKRILVWYRPERYGRVYPASSTAPARP